MPTFVILPDLVYMFNQKYCNAFDERRYRKNTNMLKYIKNIKKSVIQNTNVKCPETLQ